MTRGEGFCSRLKRKAPTGVNVSPGFVPLQRKEHIAVDSALKLLETADVPASLGFESNDIPAMSRDSGTGT